MPTPKSTARATTALRIDELARTATPLCAAHAAENQLVPARSSCSGLDMSRDEMARRPARPQATWRLQPPHRAAPEEGTMKAALTPAIRPVRLRLLAALAIASATSAIAAPPDATTIVKKMK